MAAVKTEYKDRLFNFIFGREENKEWTLSLYNAVNGSSYTNPDDIKINTIREILYLGMRNDVSFLISGDLNLYEQQSSYNPNMPVRLLQYAGHLFESYITENKLNKYGSKLIELPVPKLVVFYNGTKEMPDEQILKLSDSFPEGAASDIEVRVRVINVNHGRNLQTLEACRPLYEYSWVIQKVRENNKELDDIEAAIEKTITEIPKEFILKSFLETHRAEVRGMLSTEYNEEEVKELFMEEGRKEGRVETITENIKSVMKAFHVSIEQAMDALNIPVSERSKYMN